MPTNLALPAYTDIGATAGSCPVGYYGMPHAGPYTDCKVRAGWFDYDFQWCPGGRLVVAAVPTAQDGDFGELWVAQYDDAYPPNYVSHVVIETHDVWASTLILRPDGTLDLWYLVNGLDSEPHHRFSRDGGLTWSTVEIHNSGVFNFTGPMAPSTTFRGRHPLPACLQAGLLAMVMDGGDVGTGGVFLFVAKLKADGERWEFTGKKHIGGTDQAGAAYDAGIGNITDLQPLPDGSILTSPASPGAGHITKLKADATCVIEWWGSGAAPSGSGTFPRTGLGPREEVDVRNGRKVELFYFVVLAGQPLYEFKGGYAWSQSEFNTSFRWEQTGETVYPAPNAQINGQGEDAHYPAAIRARNGQRFFDDGDDSFESTNAICKQRPDGRWEVLRVNEQSELEFARCSVMPNDNVTTWVGR